MSRFYRGGAGLLGAGLMTFGVVGLRRGLAFLSTEGPSTMGMGSNGLLSTISVVVGAVLVAAAVWGGVVASSTMAVAGALFVISGLVNLALLGTALNILAFRFPNVAFSLVVGVLLLVAGLHGRLSGGLPPDNPFERARHPRDPEELARERTQLAEHEQMARAEYAVANGRATAEQAATVRADRLRRAQADFRGAHRLPR